MTLLLNDTVPLVVVFDQPGDTPDDPRVPYDPVRVEFCAYDENKTPLIDPVDVTANQDGPGRYVYDYVTPETGRAVVLEMVGYDAADNPHRIARMERLRFA